LHPARRAPACARARPCSPWCPRPCARLPNASRIPKARAPRHLVTRAARTRRARSASPSGTPLRARRPRPLAYGALGRGTSRLVAVKAPLFAAYKTVAVGSPVRTPSTSSRRPPQLLRAHGCFPPVSSALTLPPYSTEVAPCRPLAAPAASSPEARSWRTPHGGAAEHPRRQPLSSN
jgi:hypothetical protein